MEDSTSKGQPIDAHTFTGEKPEIDKLFNAMIKAGGTDLHLKVGYAPRIRIQSELKKSNAAALTEKYMEKLVFELLTEKQKQDFLKKGSFDFGHSVSQMDRFRINIFRQRGTISLVARHITSNIPSFEELNLPPVINHIANTAHEGLILATGPTGCGKTTTISYMIDYINRHRASHIVTIEDPIEYLHIDHKSSVSQREIGIDCIDYEDALRYLMRQDPDVVMIGEIRDRETLTAAMRAADTGHLVFGTLHALSASQAIQRILDLFPQDERDLARTTFSLTFRAIISQHLIKGLNPKFEHVPAVEILLANPVTRNLIAEKREADIPTAIRSGKGEGMQDYTDSLEDLIRREMVSLEDAMNCAPNVEELKMALKGVRASTTGLL